MKTQKAHVARLSFFFILFCVCDSITQLWLIRSHAAVNYYTPVRRAAWSHFWRKLHTFNNIGPRVLVIICCIFEAWLLLLRVSDEKNEGGLYRAKFNNKQFRIQKFPSQPQPFSRYDRELISKPHFIPLWSQTWVWRRSLTENYIGMYQNHLPTKNRS